MANEVEGSEREDEIGRSERGHTNQQRWREHIASPLAGAILAGAFTLAGAWIGAELSQSANREALERQFAEQRLADAREKRGKAYANYLNAANDYAVATDDAAEILQRHQGERLNPSEITNEIAPFIKARHSYQSAVNELYIYGSDAAWEAHQAIAATLPRAVAPFELPERAVDYPAFSNGFINFQRIMCQEVSPVPRKNC